MNLKYRIVSYGKPLSGRGTRLGRHRKRLMRTEKKVNDCLRS